MDIDMDIDFDAGIQPAVQPQPVQQINDTSAEDTPMPAAYYEDLGARPTRPARTLEQWPDHVNLQGVDDFGPMDAVYYLMKTGCEQKIKQQRWVNDTSLNLQFHSPEDATLALHALTDPEVGDPASIPAETSRKAKPFVDKPHLSLTVRQANSGDQKERNAGNRSKYYESHPDIRGGDRRADRGREREPRRRPPPRRDFLDYGDEEPARGNRPGGSGDEQMRDGSDYENRRNRRNGNRDRDGRLRAADVDSYRPGSKSPRESRYGRLRGRSASPASDDDGDGRYGFTEAGTSTRRAYRSRSRSRNNQRRREPSVERWAHDRANYDREPGGRWEKDTSALRYSDAFSSTSNHRRSDAFDETANNGRGSLLSRMTKDGQPVAPTGRSLASRITRDTDESSYGRLKDDDSAPAYVDFSEPAPKRGLASRMTRDDDEIQIRGRSRDLEGINIRGSASQGGFSIRGVAGGA